MVTLKKIHLKDSRQNITKQLASYLSVVVATMLVAVAILGFGYSAKSISDSGDSFYDSCNYRDVEISSDVLISSGEIEDIRSMLGVADVEGAYRASGQINNNGKKTDAIVVSMTERINVVQMIEGRLPSETNECVIEKTLADNAGLVLGDTFKVTDSDGFTPDYLSESEFTVTGIAYHPDHACSPDKTPGARYVIVKPEAFDKERLGNCFMAVEITLAGTRGLDRFSDIYLARVSLFMASLDSRADKNETTRYNEVVERSQRETVFLQSRIETYTNEISEERKKLDSDWKDYDTSIAQYRADRRAFNESQSSLIQANTDLKDLKDEIEKTKQKLATDKTAMEKTEADLKTTKTKLEKTEKELKKSKEKLTKSYKPFESAKSSIRSSMKSAVTSVLGSSVAGKINWSKSTKAVNPDDSKTTATKLAITSKVTVDLTKPVKTNVVTLLKSAHLSEQELIEAYENTTGNTFSYDGGSALQTIAGYIASNYSGKFGDYLSDAKEWDAEQVKHAKAKKEYDKAKKKYDDDVKKLASDKKAYDTKTKNNEQAMADYEEGLADYNTKMAAKQDDIKKFDDQEKALADRRAALEEREKEYSFNVTRLEEKKAEYEKRQIEIGSSYNCRWMAVDGRGNAGYQYIFNARKVVGNTGLIIALLFAVIAVLVIYATISYLINSRKHSIGQSKAMGLSNGEIRSKFLIFGMTASFFGIAIGACLGYFGIYKLLMAFFENAYVFAQSQGTIDIALTVITVVLGLLISGSIVWLAVRKTLNRSASELMRDDGSPASVKSKKHSRKKRFGKNSVFRSMTLFNMRNDKKRVIAAVAVIAGCFAVIVAGLMTNINLNKTIDQQYKNIELYDLKISFDLTQSRNAEYEIGTILQEEGAYFASISENEIFVGSKDNLTVSKMICGDLDNLDSFFVRRDTGSLAQTTASGYGIWIPFKMAKDNGFAKDEWITLYDNSMNPYPSRVAGIFENRIGNYSIMERRVYTAVFSKTPVNNAYLVILNGANADSIISRVSAVEGFTGIENTQDRYDEVKTSYSILNYMPVICLIIVVLMAFFILFDLFNMSVESRKADLESMTINGFSIKEMRRYISLEFIVVSVMGTVVGLLAGTGLGILILAMMQGSDLHAIKMVRFEALGIATVVMAIVLFLISFISLLNVKKTVKT